jgi:hypothetical protein
MADRSRKQSATIPSKNPFVDGGGSEWAQVARACPILTQMVRGQAGRKSLYMCNPWRQNNWRKQRIIRIERNESPTREPWKQDPYQLLQGASRDIVSGQEHGGAKKRRNWNGPVPSHLRLLLWQASQACCTQHTRRR